VTAAHLSVQRVGLVYGSRQVLSELDLLAQGGLITLLGANGAGKTTLLRCLATVMAPDTGTVMIDGLSPHREPERVEIRRRLGYLPQEFGFAPGARTFDAVDHIAVLKGYREDRKRRGLVFDALARVGLDGRAGDATAKLSGGMRRRLGLAQAILGDPTLLVLDEPAAGLDPDERQRMRQVLSERRRDATTIVSTHLTDEASDADVIWVLHRSTIAFADTPSRLAGLAAGRTWVQTSPPPHDVRASWRLADGTYRCLGLPPPNADLVAPRIEDGYLLLTT
jgi:ABC-2 type transport system ATP-binding protein